MTRIDAGGLDAHNLRSRVSFEWAWPLSKVRATVTGYLTSVTHDTNDTTIELVGDDGSGNEPFSLDHGAAVDVNPS